MNQDHHYTPQGEPIHFDQNPYGSQPKQTEGNGFAIASLCLGIGSLVCCCCLCCLYYLSAVLSILSIVMAVVAKKKNGGKMHGKAIAGLILAIIGLLLFVLFLGVEIYFASIPEEELMAMLDEMFMDTYGVTFEEYIKEYLDGAGIEYAILP